MNIALISLWISLVGFAHEGGHGEKHTEPGPSGGFLSSVILAKDVSAGEKAPTVALAEWKKNKGELSLRLLTEKKVPFLSLTGGELKWIVLRKKQKPQILVHKIQERENEFSLQLDNEKNIEGVEAILPPVSGGSSKLVAIVFSQQWKR